MGKTFVLSDESVNGYGFRVLTAGIDLTRFEKNPVLLWNHTRSRQDAKDTILPIGRWENVRVENGRLLGDAVFDMEDEFARQVSQKVDAGIISGCSIGIEILCTSAAAGDVIAGQTRETVTGSRLMEASVCDIPANANAVSLMVSLSSQAPSQAPLPTGRDKLLVGGGEDIGIPVLNLNNKKEMNLTLILTALSLALTAGETEIVAAITQLKDSLREVTSDRDRLVAELAGVQKAETERLAAEAERLGNEGVRTGRFSQKLKESFVEMYMTNPDMARRMYDFMPERKSLAGQAVTGGSELSKLSWDELDRQEKLAELKESDPDLYAAKYREKFGS